SLLLQAVKQTHEKIKMPPKKQLSEEQIADLTKWIADGAAWPPVRVPASVGKPNPEYDRLRKEHWAWQPLAETKPPAVKDPAWVRDYIDRFILAKLEARGLKPVGDADRVSLIRRVSFDLIGLPPTPDEVQAFLADTSPDAFARVVDRLLASPGFGEHWGRHWLDLAPYRQSPRPPPTAPPPPPPPS